MDRPLLLDGYKWDARVYVLVLPASSCGRRNCYLAREGLVRVCLDPYEPPESRNLHRHTVHLTNYSLSKFSDKFVFNEDPTDAHNGCKRTLSAVLSRIEADGLARITSETVWQTLGRLV